MSHDTPVAGGPFITHEVFNQVPAIVDTNLYTGDQIFFEAVLRYDGMWAHKKLKAFGSRMGSAEVQTWARQANEFEPVLKTHDRTGRRIDTVEFHPAWHNLMSLATEYGMHNLPWSSTKPGTHLIRAAMMFMAYQTEAGHCCPISMTYSAVPALRNQPELAKVWEPLISNNSYDGQLIKASQKGSAIFGMGMTEKQGGSDVRANTTKALAAEKAGPGQMYMLTGHKWFCSAPMSDAFLMLAQTEKGLSCFLVPRILEDGTANAFFIQRLKDKLGNRSNASSEIELRDTVGFLVGEEGRGVPTIIEMVNHTRLDCAVGSASLMRRAVQQAIHHAKHRSTFGKRLINQPLMQPVLADLALEAEAGVLLALRLAYAYDNYYKQEGEEAFRRVTSAVAKYWLCKRAPWVVAESLECLGGNGYVEESEMPRLFRESPLNSIWEGAGNVMCLDVLRAIAKEPIAIDALEEELKLVSQGPKKYHKFAENVVSDLRKIRKELVSDSGSTSRIYREARVTVEKMALAIQASLMLRDSSKQAGEAFVATRLGSKHGYTFGTIPSSVASTQILERYAKTV